MPKLGIWRLMVHPNHHHDHHHHDHDVNLRGHHLRQGMTEGRHHHHCDDDAEIFVKPSLPKLKDNTEEEESGTISEEPAAVDIATKVEEEAPKKKSVVSFSNVGVRTYELILGDNPDCSFPLSLGWRYKEEPTVHLDVFEQQQQRQQQQHDNNGRRRRRKDHSSGDDDDYTQHVGELLGLLAPPATTSTVDPLMRTMLMPLTLHERRVRLRAQGHSEQSLRQAERKRRIELSLQWASGQFPKQQAFPYSQRFFLNYVL